MFKDKGNSFLTSTCDGCTDLGIEIDIEDENAVPGAYQVEFEVTSFREYSKEEREDELKVTSYEFTIIIPAEEEDNTDDSTDADSTLDIEIDVTGETELPTIKIVDITILGVVELELSLPMVGLLEPNNLNTDHLLITIDGYEDNMEAYHGFTWETIEFKE